MIFLDFETRSRADLSAVGSWLYAADPSTDLLCVAWAIGSGPVESWRPGKPLGLLRSLFDAVRGDHLVEAHNAGFERAIWEKVAGPRYQFPYIPVERWRCSMARASMLALPRSLEALAKALGLPVRKDLDGRKVMKRATAPLKVKAGGLFGPSGEWEEDPTVLERVEAYCRQDVEVERAASAAMPQLPERELRIWQLDQKINARGIQVDRALCANALRLLEGLSADFCYELLRLTNGAVKAPTEIEGIKTWLAETQDLFLVTLDAKAVEEALAQKNLSRKARRVLEIRAAAGRSSVAKFASMLERSDSSGRMRDLLIYHGAQPGRWAGQGAQIQNYPRGSIKAVEFLAEMFSSGELEDLGLFFDPMEAAVSALRPALMAPPGWTLLIWDFAQIEARVLAWFAKCEKLLRLFRSGADVYKAFAAEALGKRIDQITKDERFIGKTCILGLGYGMGAAKLFATFEGYGVNVSAGLCARLVASYRAAYPEIPRAWAELEDAAILAAKNSARLQVGPVVLCQGSHGLRIELPAGRAINYPEAKVQGGKLIYKKALGAQQVRAETYGGKLTENVIQGIARDVMAEGMLRLDAADFGLTATVHDEIIAEKPEANAKIALERGKKLLETSPAWCDVPLAVEGFCSRRYKK